MLRKAFRYLVPVRCKSNSSIAGASTAGTSPSLPQTLQRRIEEIPLERYRNFSIVAHVDHGKSTLSDRLLELTGVVKPGAKQVLDKLEVERERGITVKAQTCSMFYHDKRTGLDYLLHLVDTPGHVDFRSEVSRSYASCGGALLLVDASQGVQAQTVANFYLAYSMNLKLLPVINKIDLSVANIAQAEDQVEDMFELPREDIVRVSAKTGLNVADLLPAIVDRIPPPTGYVEKPFRALLVDSWYDSYLGVVLLVYCVDGMVKKGDKIVSAHTSNKYEVKEVGIMYPERVATGKLSTGQVGYLVPGFKNSRDAKIGDTLMHQGRESETEVLPGFEEQKPMVFVGAFPADGAEFKALDDDIQRLVLNDRSVTLQRETSNALGQGWRLGFLGSLHASVFKERLENEYGSKLIITQPTVPYVVEYSDGTQITVTNPDDFPDLTLRRTKIKNFQEPYVEAIMTLPQDYLGRVITLCDDNRGIQKEITYINTTGQVMLKYDIPLAHLVDDFFGKLKSVTHGYASLDYEDAGYKPSDIVKMELLVNGKGVDALAQVMHRSQTERVAKEWVRKFKQYVKSQLYEVVIQAKANNKVLARETIKARRKDVLAKLHASDVSRRKKLLVKQKEGKKQMRSIGNVHIDQEAYQAFLRK
ncbi:AGR290Wp [Eremothecium gossypii ATCC 10895]|uniref:Translation factor GUF1, mitochondrial n=1 Tax=Eremothecium gossypii (strain ATCC 10895 / CBS 109.51 / FGSC 9923 / NRRL Y-1056) TaxID=284811 RepID=GUF1_EREGS|nr:AGR290Wp [Eremothecium gossypii ATCC 10895]Q74ZG2.1 RecName: Full=Translation factor GUF1, mitochondrial; AltName: Full=Elongation factor 4 homolog; Short=EF-4; AltName: Full=GTPase GUF1; AltName: Full=Ribosomal back-translocase; Flags: Precursor [Eremothecium gossypii ATCC 10895]AAS54780.1 AGR290Wp [Eremothecium gossypii ATCC 10895]AEY99111.1 FAGR290Wp [Eremothecium gossypii FDAG1]